MGNLEKEDFVERVRMRWQSNIKLQVDLNGGRIIVLISV